MRSRLDCRPGRRGTGAGGRRASCRPSAWAPSVPTRSPADAVAEAVLGAASGGLPSLRLRLGLRQRAAIGHSLQRLLASGVRRDELWITSKLWNDKHGERDVIPSCEQSLRDLQLDYLDLYLVHWPFPNYHPPGCDVNARSPGASPYIHERYMATWRSMEGLWPWDSCGTSARRT